MVITTDHGISAVTFENWMKSLLNKVWNASLKANAATNENAPTIKNNTVEIKTGVLFGIGCGIGCGICCGITWNCIRIFIIVL